ncbi:MAG: DUF4412 domain-containing protein [Bacteroidales bacterium]|nr:DUF4412 domain-containing protein [Bacteroidales bacterium]
MSKIFLSTIIILHFLFSIGQPFEGSISFIKKTVTDTTFYTYNIKDELVKVDEKDINMNIINSLIVNLQENTMIAISPLRQMYMNLPVQIYIKNNDTSFVIDKTKETKTIKEFECELWIVSNKSQDTKIEYWVVKDNFAFFEKFLKLANRSEKSSIYFLNIPEKSGYFPMLSIEKTLSGNEKLRLEVTEIKKGVVDEKIFELPYNYLQFNH